MKNLILICFFFAFTASVRADTFVYDLYYDQEKTERLDIKVELVLSAQFERESKVESLKIWGKNKSNKPVLLFDVPAKNIKGRWINRNTISISSIADFEPLVNQRYIPIHSDTFINPGEEYSFENLILNAEGSLDEDGEGFFLANQSQEEMALNGFLKR